MNLAGCFRHRAIDDASRLDMARQPRVDHAASHSKETGHFFHIAIVSRSERSVDGVPDLVLSALVDAANALAVIDLALGRKAEFRDDLDQPPHLQAMSDD